MSSMDLVKRKPGPNSDSESHGSMNKMWGRPTAKRGPATIDVQVCTALAAEPLQTITRGEAKTARIILPQYPNWKEETLSDHLITSNNTMEYASLCSPVSAGSMASICRVCRQHAASGLRPSRAQS